MTNVELLFQQWWTIEMRRSMDEPHEAEQEHFVAGYRYAMALVEQMAQKDRQYQERG